MKISRQRVVWKLRLYSIVHLNKEKNYKTSFHIDHKQFICALWNCVFIWLVCFTIPGSYSTRELLSPLRHVQASTTETIECMLQIFNGEQIILFSSYPCSYFDCSERSCIGLCHIDCLRTPRVTFWLARIKFRVHIPQRWEENYKVNVCKGKLSGV